MNTEESSSVKWKSYDATILENLHSHYTKASFCDATILCEGRMFPVHKLILSLSSDYFNEIFSSTPPWNQPYIVITGINATNMDYILTYIYSGEISVSQLELPSFLVAAECLKIKRLDSSSENVHENPNHPSASQKNPRFLKQPRNGPGVHLQQQRIANRKMAIVPKPGGNKRQLITQQQSVKKQKLSVEQVENMYLEEEEQHHISDYDVNETKMQMINDNIMIKPEHIDPEYEEYEMQHQLPEWEEDSMENEHAMNVQPDELMDPEDSENYFLPVKQEYLDDSYEEYNEMDTAQVMPSAVKTSTSYSESITPNAPNMKIHSTSITLHPSSRSTTQDTNTALNTQRRAVPSTSQSNQKMKPVTGSERSIPAQKQGSAQFKSKYGPKPFNSSVSINPLVILESNPDEEKQTEENLDDSLSSVTEIEDPYDDNEELSEEMLLQDPEEMSGMQSTVYSDSSITIMNARNEMGQTAIDESRYYDQSRQWKGVSVSQESSFLQQSKNKRQPTTSDLKIAEATRKLPTGSNVKISDARKSGMPHHQMNNARHQMLSGSSLVQKQMNQRQQQLSGQKQGSAPPNQHISPKQLGMVTKFQQHSIPRQQLNVTQRPESISSPEPRQINSPVTPQHQRQIAGQRGNKFGVQKQNFAHPSQIPFSKPDTSYERRDSSSPNSSDSGCQSTAGGRPKQPNMNISSSLSSKIPQCLTESTSITISQTSNRPVYQQKQRPGPKSKVSQVPRQQAPIKNESPVPKVHSISSSNLPPPASPRSQTPVNTRSQTPVTSKPQNTVTSRPQTPVNSRSQTPVTSRPQTPVTSRPQTPVTSRPQPPATPRPVVSSTPRPQPTVSQVNPSTTMTRPQASSTPRVQTTSTSRPQPVQTPVPRSGTTTVSKPQPLSLKSQQSPSMSPQHIGSPKSSQQTSDPRSPKSGPKQNQATATKPQLSSPKHTVTDSTIPLIEVKQEPAEGAEPYDEQQHIEDLERLFNSGAFGSLPGEAPAKPSALEPNKKNDSTFLDLNNIDILGPPREVYPCKRCNKTFSSKGHDCS